MAYGAVVFDLDGTILDTLDDLWASVNFALASEGLPPRSREEVRARIGNGVRQLVRLSIPEGTSAACEERAFAAFQAHYQDHAADHTAPYPGIPGLLGRLRAAGLPLAVVSNKSDEVVRDLVTQHFPGCFQVVVGEREGVRRKPAPDSLLVVMGELGVEPGQVLYVGDSEVDLATAANAGVRCASVTWGFRDESYLREQGATLLVHSCDELEAVALGDVR